MLQQELAAYLSAINFLCCCCLLPLLHKRASTGTSTRLSDSLVAVALTHEEVALAQALLGRVAKLAAAAVGTNVKLIIDAEHSYFQPVSYG
jgi:hypothetical protein